MLPAVVRNNMREDKKSGNRFSESAQTSLVVSQSRLRWGAKHYPMRSSNASSWGPYPGEGPALQRERQRNGISGMGHRLRQRYPRLSSRERPEHSSSHRVRPVSQQSCQGSPTTVTCETLFTKYLLKYHLSIKPLPVRCKTQRQTRCGRILVTCL